MHRRHHGIVAVVRHVMPQEIDRPFRPTLGRFLLIWTAPIFALAGCSPGTSAREERMTYGEAGKVYTADVAQQLSIASSQDLPEESATVRAINCAAAVRITNEALSDSTAGIGAEGMAAMRQAEAIFVQRARLATGGDPQEAIARRVRDVREDMGGQAQLAVACIRSIA